MDEVCFSPKLVVQICSVSFDVIYTVSADDTVFRIVIIDMMDVQLLHMNIYNIIKIAIDVKESHQHAFFLTLLVNGILSFQTRKLLKWMTINTFQLLPEIARPRRSSVYRQQRDIGIRRGVQLVRDFFLLFDSSYVLKLIWSLSLQNLSGTQYISCTKVCLGSLEY